MITKKKHQIFADAVPIRTNYPNRIIMDECKLICTYSFYYDLQDLEPKYIIDMNVTPLMTAQIANKIKI